MTTLETLEAERIGLELETYRWLQDVVVDECGDILSFDAHLWGDEPEACGIDVRLQVMPDGSYVHHSGAACFDQDHRGFWGAGSVSASDDDVALISTARDLVSQVLDAAAQSEA